MQQVQGAGLFWSGRNAAESRDCPAAGGFQPHMHTALILNLTTAGYFCSVYNLRTAGGSHRNSQDFSRCSARHDNVTPSAGPDMPDRFRSNKDFPVSF